MPNQAKKISAPTCAKVLRVNDISHGFKRVTLHSEDFRTVSKNCTGGHLKLLFPKPDAPGFAELIKPDSEWRTHCIARTYTLLSVRPEEHEIDIEFALHPGRAGPGATWVRSASIGDEILLTRPSERKLNNLHADFYLFVCDSCSVPATHAALCTLPQGAQGIIIVNTDDDSDAGRLASLRSGFQTHHIRRDLSLPASVVAATHISMLRSLDLPTTDIECFVVGESRVVKEVKQYLKGSCMIDPSSMYFSPYWKQHHTQDEHKQYKRAQREDSPPEVHVVNTKKTSVASA